MEISLELIKILRKYFKFLIEQEGDHQTKIPIFDQNYLVWFKIADFRFDLNFLLLTKTLYSFYTLFNKE